ncbi:hypothetical protein CYXG_00022 [Synechococcus phage S-SSM4]|uniref:Uncharacterized protein n=1 Tax=Synechococcus phage S-SSM4 TaxID=536466 RepID=M1U9B0_9CAUD|nr:hypothetical protein CYXG_00022 [Synechococcus phage S-SSM4]AGG54086.1 hypothetical protein CYXG_00022 [Synechococcus phage S-SSM4]AGG54337.1 hypothetical protein CYWG_00053 [Cyanophage S-SSM6b]
MPTTICEQLQPHEPPDGYRYETVRQKSNVLAIWIVSIRGFLYNDNNPARSIWGFYNTKTKQYHAPINSKKVGSVVQLEKTRPYSAMQIKRIGLEQFM